MLQDIFTDVTGMVSVPFRGLLIPNDMNMTENARLVLVSVPFRGLLIPNVLANTVYIAIYHSFRPLPGSPYS